MKTRKQNKWTQLDTGQGLCIHVNEGAFIQVDPILSKLFKI